MKFLDSPYNLKKQAAHENEEDNSDNSIDLRDIGERIKKFS